MKRFVKIFVDFGLVNFSADAVETDDVEEHEENVGLFFGSKLICLEDFLRDEISS